VIRINEPVQFRDDLAKALGAYVECVKVSYTKEKEIGREEIPCREERLIRSYSQKSEEYKNELVIIEQNNRIQ